MMKFKKIFKLAVAGSVLLAGTTAVAHNTATTPFPHEGTFYYNGFSYMELNFSNYTHQNYVISNDLLFETEGLELDVVIGSNAFESCTSWSNLPNSYDDCVTAGLLEVDDTTAVFGHGTYDISALNPDANYWVSFDVKFRDSFTSAPLTVTWGEVYPGLCPIPIPILGRSPWCQLSTANIAVALPRPFANVAGGRLFSNPPVNLQRGTPHTHFWRDAVDGQITVPTGI